MLLDQIDDCRGQAQMLTKSELVNYVVDDFD